MTTTTANVQRIIAAHEARRRAEICEQLGQIVPRIQSASPSHHRAILSVPAHKRAAP